MSHTPRKAGSRSECRAILDFVFSVRVLKPRAFSSRPERDQFALARRTFEKFRGTPWPGSNHELSLHKNSIGPAGMRTRDQRMADQRRPQPLSYRAIVGIDRRRRLITRKSSNLNRLLHVSTPSLPPPFALADVAQPRRSSPRRHAPAPARQPQPSLSQANSERAAACGEARSGVRQEATSRPTQTTHQPATNSSHRNSSRTATSRTPRRPTARIFSETSEQQVSFTQFRVCCEVR